MVIVLDCKCQESVDCMLKKPLGLHDEKAFLAESLQNHFGCMLHVGETSGLHVAQD